MRRLGKGLLFAVAGYPIGALAGYLLISGLSSNEHDASLEAAMTSAFVFGPLGAIIGFAAGIVRGGSRSPRVDPPTPQ